MRIVLPGGSGQIGQVLARHLHAQGHEVTVLSRSPQPAPWQTVAWDGATLDEAWTQTLEGAEAVINLAGRSVNCRYTPEHRREILESRAHSTFVLGRAIERAKQPPRVWLNASTATLYRHSLDKDQDEYTGELGGSEPDVPDSWGFSVEVARAWEHACSAWNLPSTRRVALRTSMVMSPDPGGVFSVLLGLVRYRLGGTQGPGNQYVSWIHEQDFVRAIDFLLTRPGIVGPVNLTSPRPVRNQEFMRTLRHAAGVKVGLPASRWMLEIGALLLGTETELVLKSRCVLPSVLMHHGFDFHYDTWPQAARNLVRRYSKRDRVAG